MFAPGDKEIPGVSNISPARLEENRRWLAFLREAFSPRLEETLLSSLPDAEEALPPVLPLGWEQRSDASGQVRT